MQKLVYHKIKLQVTPNTKKNSSRSKGDPDFLPTPPFSAFCSRSRTTRSRRVCTGRFGNCCAGHRRHRSLTAGPHATGEEAAGLLVRAGNLDSPIAVPACVTLSGLRGASCQVPFQEWCHFHRGLTVAPWQFRHQKG